MEAYIQRIDNVELIGTYNNPIEGIMAIDKHKPDLLFLYVSMPEIDAFTTLGALEHEPKTIIVSSHWELEKELLEAGADLFLPKPLKSIDHLKEAIAKVLS